MNHNDFDFLDDLIMPFHHFLKQIGISTRKPKQAFFQTTIDSSYFAIPQTFIQIDDKKNSWDCCYNNRNNLFNVDIRTAPVPLRKIGAQSSSPNKEIFEPPKSNGNGY